MAAEGATRIRLRAVVTRRSGIAWNLVSTSIKCRPDPFFTAYMLMRKSVAKDEVVFASEWSIRHARV